MSRRLGALLLAIPLLLPAGARAQRSDPVSVEVEGSVVVEAGAAPPTRDALLHAALVEAVAEVARRMLLPAVYGPQREAIRAALDSRAASFVLTFRTGAARSQPAAESPETAVEHLQPLSATVDARRLRAFMASAGWPPAEAIRPSAVVCVRPESGTASAETEAAFVGLQRFVAAELRARDFVMIEPGIREGAPDCELGALELARRLGADTGVELRVGWRAQTAARGPGSVIAEVALSAQRADDGSELALGRFQGVGHHDAPPEALARALEAAQPQVVENLTLQLTRNWQEIASAGGPVELQLLGLTGLSQAFSVRELLEERMGVRRTELLELGPGSARLRVDGSLSPGSLQDRLVAAQFDGFRLEPGETGPDHLSLRVEALPPEPPSAPGQIDTQEPD